MANFCKRCGERFEKRRYNQLFCDAYCQIRYNRMIAKRRRRARDRAKRSEQLDIQPRAPDGRYLPWRKTTDDDRTSVEALSISITASILQGLQQAFHDEVSSP